MTAKVNGMGALMVSLMLLPSVNLFAEEVQTVTFNYNPPDNLHYQARFEAIQKKTLETGGEQTSQSEDVTLLKSIYIEKQDQGWVETHEVEKLSMYRNGQLVDNPLINATLKRTLQYHISPTGNLDSVSGYEGVVDSLQGKLPEKLLTNIAGALTPARLSAKDEADWNGRFGGLAGKTVEIGSEEVKTTPYQLPTGDRVEYTTTTRFVGWETCGSEKCFRIEQVYSGDLQEAAEALLDKAHKMTQKLRPELHEEETALEQMEALLEGKTVILLQPETLLPFYEQQDRHLRMVARIPGKGNVPVEQISRKEMTYTYPD